MYIVLTGAASSHSTRQSLEPVQADHISERLLRLLWSFLALQLDMVNFTPSNLSVDIFCATSAGVGKTLTSHRSRYISSSRLSFHPESMEGLRCPSINQYGHFSLPCPAMKHRLVCVYLLPPLVLARQFIMCKPTTRGSENPLGGKFTFMFTTKPPHGMTHLKRYLSGARRITGNTRNRFAVKSPTGLNQE